jgi:hypothetical protein
MQNSNPLPPQKEFDPLEDLIERFKLAFKVLTTKKALVVVPGEVYLVNIKTFDAYQISKNVGNKMLGLESTPKVIRQTIYLN